MDITPLVPKGRQLIQRYGNGAFLIGGETFTGSVLVLPERTVAVTASLAADITLQMLAPLEGSGTELLLIGSGARMEWLDISVRAHLKAMSIAVEVMDTGAACRTFNVLLGEERKVAALLMAV